MTDSKQTVTIEDPNHQSERLQASPLRMDHTATRWIVAFAASALIICCFKITYNYLTGDSLFHEYGLYEILLGGMAGWVVGLLNTRLVLTSRKLQEESRSRLELRKTLVESEQRYRNLIDNMQEGLVEVDANWQITFVNDGFVRMSGYSRELLIGMRFFNLVSREYHTTAEMAHFQRVQGKTGSYELELIRLDGQPILALCSPNPVYDAAGIYQGGFGIITDITERKRLDALVQAERDLAASWSRSKTFKERLDACLDTAIRISSMDCGGLYVQNEDRTEYRMIVHQGLSDRFVSRVMSFPMGSDHGRLIQEGEPIYTLHRNLIPERASFGQEEGLKSIAVIPVTGNDMAVACLNVASHSLNHVPEYARAALERIARFAGNFIAQELLEEESRQNRQNLETLFNGIEDMLFVLDMNGFIIRHNPIVGKRLEYPDDELIGRHVLDVHPADRHPEAMAIIADMLSGKKETCQIPLITRSGRVIPVETRIKLSRWQDRDVMFGVSRDVTERQEMETRLQKTMEKYRFLAENMADIVWIMDRNLKATYVSQSITRVLGFTPRERKEQTLEEMIMPESLRQGLALFEKEILNNPNPDNDPDRLIILELEFRHAAGHTVWMENRVKILRDSSGAFDGLYGSSQNITKRRMAEEALRESESRYRILAENAMDVIFTVDMDNRMTYVSPSITRLLGFPVEEAMARTMQEAYTPAAFEKAMTLLSEEMEVEFSGRGDPDRSRIVELEMYRKNGTVAPVEGNFSFLRDSSGRPAGILAILRDITERRQADEALKSSLREKEILLHEVHHRVKNNMQIISSLLNLQAADVPDEDVRQALLDNQQRITSMSMIHEALYSGKNLSRIDLSAYLNRLIQYLESIFSIHATVHIETGIDDIQLDMDQAVPCGLIINELVTNAFKHAFPHGRKGVIQLKVFMENDTSMVLMVSDNGVGFPPNLDIENPGTLGLKLVRGLLTHQLKGSLNLAVETGTVFTIRWPLPERKGDTL